MKKILITGGPVGANLDAVKIITNKFKGGRMANLAEVLRNPYDFSTWSKYSNNITYLTTKDSHKPFDDDTNCVFHNGFNDYRNKVLELAPQMDAVILGAAVCNLIPFEPWVGKFPSHKYKVGDVFDIKFTIAPRVVDEVKRVMKPGAHLFAFKLLSGVSREELISAAYNILLESKATAVIANDAKDLDTKLIVTKERGVHEYDEGGYYQFILDCMNDKYYKSEVKLDGMIGKDVREACNEYTSLVHRFSEKFYFAHGENKLVFGSVAVRCGMSNGFVTSCRGKEGTSDVLSAFSNKIVVKDVDHEGRVVKCIDGRAVKDQPVKATLNAPLFHHLFKINPSVTAIIHYHIIKEGLPVVAYAIPGTVRDSIRDMHDSFVIKDHGTFEFIRG
jgi:hypothetical protein